MRPTYCNRAVTRVLLVSEDPDHGRIDFMGGYNIYSGLAVAYLTAVREVLGSNRAVGNRVYRTTTVIYSLGHELCAPFLQCIGQLTGRLHVPIV